MDINTDNDLLLSSESSTDPKKKISLINKIIIGICFLAIIGSLIIYYLLKNKINNKVNELMSSKEEFTENDNIENNNIENDNIENDNTLNYYGAHYCPHSNLNSLAYKTILNFSEKYPDIKVQYYMREENEYIFNKVRPKYVPTIMYNNKDINLSLPREDLKDLSQEEAEEKVLDNIYKQILI